MTYLLETGQKVDTRVKVEGRGGDSKENDRERAREKQEKMKLKGWACCNGNATSGEDLQMLHSPVSGLAALLLARHRCPYCM